MSTIGLRSRRTAVPGAIGAIGVLVAVLVLALASPPAGAAGRFRAGARVHAAKSEVSTVRVRIAATATATAGSPAVRAEVTVHVWATGTGRATAGAWARAHRTGSTPARARAAARAAAHHRAAHRARSRALALARSRALAAARAIGEKRAQAAARQAAVTQARTLAATGGKTADPGCTTLPKAGGGTWRCSFDDEFNGTALDTSKWQVLTSAATGLATGYTCFVDSPDTVAVGGGVLSLTVRKLAAPMTCPTASQPISTSYAGGQIGTYGHFSQTYGRFAVRAKFPAAVVSGLQSSLWMWPVTSPTGEIDIAEWYSQYPDRVVPFLHYAYDASKTTSVNPLTGTNVVTNNDFLVKDVNAFHEYAVEWTASTLTITVDGRVALADHIAASGASPFDQPFFLLLTACLGSGTNTFDPQGTPLPATTQIDWVRAWK